MLGSSSEMAAPTPPKVAPFISFFTHQTEKLLHSESNHQHSEKRLLCERKYSQICDMLNIQYI